MKSHNFFLQKPISILSHFSRQYVRILFMDNRLLEHLVFPLTHLWQPPSFLSTEKITTFKSCDCKCDPQICTSAFS